MADIIKIALAIAAVYAGGMWLYMAAVSYRSREAVSANEDLRAEIATFTFRLGLCFVLAVGFLGLMVK